MPDQTITEYLPVSFYFRVVMDNSLSTDTSFLEVSGFGQSMETESYQELGENRFIHKLPKFVNNQGNLVLKRGIAKNTSPLVKWCKKVLQEFAIPIQTAVIQVQLMNPEGKPIRSWTFEGAYPVKWSVGPFNAKTGNDIAIETIELAYTHCQRYY